MCKDVNIPSLEYQRRMNEHVCDFFDGMELSGRVRVLQELTLAWMESPSYQRLTKQQRSDQMFEVQDIIVFLTKLYESSCKM